MENTEISRLKSIADNFDYDVVLRDYALKYEKTIDEARLTLAEMKKWLILCAINRNNNYTLVGEVDSLWHTFILHTFLYHDFCDKLVGEYLHHIPDVAQRERTKKSKQSKNVKLLPNNKLVSLSLTDESANGYKDLLADMSRYFEDGYNEYLWPKIGEDGMPYCPGGCCKNSCGGCIGGGSCSTGIRY